jgi:AraC-like DNA-binding protein
MTSTAGLLTTPHRAGTVEAYRQAIERVIDYMRANLVEPLDLDHLAAIAAMSKFHLVRVFDELTGTTPRHFLACLRMQRAKQLLLCPDASITDVCMAVGYSSLGTFSKTFSTLVGLSPQDFRGLPNRLKPMQFAKAIWHFLAMNHQVTGTPLEGSVEGPAKLRGFTFVGVFDRGVPQGVPSSGTVLLKPGEFRLDRPELPEFHLLAAFIPLSADLTAIATTIPVGLVASQRVSACSTGPGCKPRLILRPLRLTDPPIVLALPALPPWRGAFVD